VAHPRISEVLYNQRAVGRIAFIARTKQLGLALDEDRDRCTLVATSAQDGGR
jgi:hypothetical protein